MAVDLDDVLVRGGARLFELLKFCVISVQLEPVFVFLVHQYRMHPSAARAVALYDVFCAQGAPARIEPPEALPPRNLRIRAAIEPIREKWQIAQAAPRDDPESFVAPPLPGRHLFDFILDHLRQCSPNRLEAVCRSYDPAKTPHENLPGGRMTAGQRAFVDRVWLPRVRPHLVSAGFAKIASVG